MTIREIAALAGVSPAAVSLVINHKKGVGEETRRRIQGVMDEYGYSPAAPRRQAARFRLMVIKFRAHGIALEENQGFIASIVDRIENAEPVSEPANRLPYDTSIEQVVL